MEREKKKKESTEASPEFQRTEYSKGEKLHACNSKELEIFFLKKRVVFFRDKKKSIVHFVHEWMRSDHVDGPDEDW